MKVISRQIFKKEESQLLAPLITGMSLWLGTAGGISGSNNCEATEAMPPVSSKVPESNAETSHILPFPFDKAGDFEHLPVKFRAPLEGFLSREFSRPDFSTAGQFVSGLAAALERAGLSQGEVEKAIATYLNVGFFMCRDLPQAFEAFQDRYPESEFLKILEPSKSLPAGWISVQIQSSGGEMFDRLTQERLERKDPDWLPVSQYELPLTVAIGVARFARNEEGVRSPEDSLDIRGHVRVWIEGEEDTPLINVPVQKTFNEHPNGWGSWLGYEFRLPDGVSKLADDRRILVEVDFAATQKSPHLLDEVNPRWNSKSFFELTQASDANGSPVGFRCTHLAPNGERLAEPLVVDALVRDILFKGVWWQKNSWRSLVQTRLERSGEPLQSLEMAYVPGAEGLLSLNLPQQGRAAIIFGASWCGPCRALAPLVREYEKRLADSAAPDKVFKVSIEDDEELSTHTADPAFRKEFPQGVISLQQRRELGVDSVPQFIRIQDGRIVEQGVLSKGILERWGAEATPDGALPSKD